MGRRIDLHAHTCCSDGSLTPAELVRLARKKELDVLAVTDHDTMEGVSEAMAEGEQIGIEVIPGIEFSTMEEGHDVHMVGLFLDRECRELKEFLKTVVDRRKDRNHKMVQRLMDAGFALTWEDTAALGDGIWTRGNLAQLLVDLGYGSSVSECMHLYLSPGCVGYEPKVAVSPAEAIQIVHRAGGLVFVAHFYQIDKKSLENSARICRKILAMGADGLETRYSCYDETMEHMAEEMAQDYNCLRSGGSDFHGKIKPGLELGDGYGHLEVPEEYLVCMKRKLGII